MAADLILPYGFFDAKYILLLQAFIGEFFQGGLIFGWNALALMLKAQGNFDRGCTQAIEDIGTSGLQSQCAWQENKLAVLWTIGVFALNFGPVLVGPVLDWLGPKLTAFLGTFLNVVALVLFGVSNSKDFNALPYASVILGLGGITFHLAQFHISNLFPRNRGLISSLLVAGFTGCGIIFYFLNLIFDSAGETRGAYRLIMILYALFCGLWIPVNFLMMPWHAVQVGQVYLWAGHFKFKVIARKELEAHLAQVRLSAHEQSHGAPANGSASTSFITNVRPDADVAMSYLGLRTAGAADPTDSSDPRWLDAGPPPPPAIIKAATGERADSPRRRRSTPVTPQHRDGSQNGDHFQVEESEANAGSNEETRKPDVEQGHGHGPGTDVVWGPLVFESRRFVELRKQTFWVQFLSAESTGMGIFYTLNVFAIQFYLGTTRLQLEHKGDANHVFTNLANIVPAFGFVGIPVIGWLLDNKGYGITLGTINCMGVLASIFQAVPNLGFQVLTILVWAFGRFFLYTSYFAIFGALFGFTNFGRMVAIDNTINGLFGLLQLPLATWGLHGLNGNFTAINLIQAGVLLPLFIFCWYMFKWEREDLVPIRPHEGEELPANPLGPRMVREAKFLATLEKHLTPSLG